ncbi:MAG: phosphatase [Lachnospiraceae bacterium]|nr:phosphatase [Lachnospiraceae bacterium]
MILLDLHTHSIASGHGSSDTITHMADVASQRGLQILGVSDHGPATPGSSSISYFQNLCLAPESRYGVRLLYGAEVNILDFNGLTDLSPDVLKHLDYAIASMHLPTRKPGSLAENTRGYIHAMKISSVKIIGHCNDGRYPVDYMELAKASRDYHVLLEINELSLSPQGYRKDSEKNCQLLLEACSKYNLPILLSSDSHGSKNIGNMPYAINLTKQMQFTDSLILNYDLQAFSAFMEA